MHKTITTLGCIITLCLIPCIKADETTDSQLKLQLLGGEEEALILKRTGTEPLRPSSELKDGQMRVTVYRSSQEFNQVTLDFTARKLILKTSLKTEEKSIPDDEISKIDKSSQKDFWAPLSPYEQKTFRSGADGEFVIFELFGKEARMITMWSPAIIQPDIDKRSDDKIRDLKPYLQTLSKIGNILKIDFSLRKSK